VIVTPRWNDGEMTASGVDRAIEALARRQHGAFSRAQATAQGATARMIRGRAASGRWIQLAPGVLALPGNPPTWERQCMAATLSVSGAVLFGTAAGALHGFTGCRRGHPHLAVPVGSHHETPLATVHQLRHIETTMVRGIPVVTAAQCLVDLPRFVTTPRARAALHDALTVNPTLLALVQDRFVDLSCSRLPHLSVVRDLLDELGDDEAPTASELERALDIVLLRVPGVPLSHRQASFPWRHGAPQRVDRLIPAWRLIIEADSRRWHTRVDDFERDRERDNEAAIHDHHVLRFTWARLAREPDRAVAQLIRYGTQFAGVGRAIVTETVVIPLRDRRDRGRVGGSRPERSQFPYAMPMSWPSARQATAAAPTNGASAPRAAGTMRAPREKSRRADRSSSACAAAKNASP
jgi:hypothetical protein